MIMKECDNCANGAWLNGKDAITEICAECTYICGEPTKWEAKLMTNADRIRAMSDEELAEFLESTHTNMAIKLGGEYIVRAKEYIEIWLKQPVE
jgi:hypothetical protein